MKRIYFVGMVAIAALFASCECDCDDDCNCQGMCDCKKCDCKYNDHIELSLEGAYSVSGHINGRDITLDVECFIEDEATSLVVGIDEATDIVSAATFTKTYYSLSKGQHELVVKTVFAGGGTHEVRSFYIK